MRGNRMQACRSGESAIAVELFMNNASQEGLPHDPGMEWDHRVRAFDLLFINGKTIKRRTMNDCEDQA
jgi:hypothetical protein